MINFNELKVGDYIIADYEGQKWEGEVTELNYDDKQICVLTEVQEFWYEPEDVYPIPISDESLRKLNFIREEETNGAVKYKKGAFRLVIPGNDDFSDVEMWYREDVRSHPNVHYIHQLQNHHLQMTKVPLTNEVIA
ncbi:MAG TPA: hypothetical protein VN958_19365 [Chitinophagaceae bacterium]|nr:hypothetical protein [Chitinophagaceae bacterium]